MSFLLSHTYTAYTQKQLKVLKIPSTFSLARRSSFTKTFASAFTVPNDNYFMRKLWWPSATQPNSTETTWPASYLLKDTSLPCSAIWRYVSDLSSRLSIRCSKQVATRRGKYRKVATNIAGREQLEIGQKLNRFRKGWLSRQDRGSPPRKDRGRQLREGREWILKKECSWIQMKVSG